MGWDKARDAIFERQKQMGIVPPDTQLHRAPALDPGLGHAVGRREAALRADDGGVRRLHLAHRPPHRPRARLPRADRRARQHDHRRDLRQRRERGGRAARLAERGELLQPRAGDRRGEPGEDRRAGRAAHVQPLPVRLDVGGQHAVPALEARGARGRRRRPVHRPLAGGHRGARRGPAAVRARRRRHRRRCSTCSASSRRTRSRASTQSPIQGTSFAHTLDEGGRAEQARDAVLRDARQPRDLPPRLEGRHVPRHRGHDLRRRHGRRASRSTRTCGSCTTSRRTSRRASDLAGEYPEKLRELQDIWWIEAAKNNVLPLDARSVGRGARPAAPDDEPQQALHLLPGRRADRGGGGGEHEEPLAHDHGGGRHPGGRRRGRAGGGRRALRRLLAVRAERQALLLVQLPRQGGLDVHVGHRRARRQRHARMRVREDGAAAVRAGRHRSGCTSTAGVRRGADPAHGAVPVRRSASASRSAATRAIR